MKMKRCELCKSMATIYCESDRASLCWTCDAKVHSANFLVARHSRTLLCKLCQSPTPWTASGEKLSPSTGSICRTCVVDCVSGIVEGVGGNSGQNYDADGNEIDNQGPPAASSSSTEECVLLKRKHQNVLDSSYEEINSLNIKHHTDSSTVPKQQTGSSHLMESSSVGIIGDKKKLRDRNIISGEYVHAPVRSMGKTTRVAEFDLNLSAIDY